MKNKHLNKSNKIKHKEPDQLKVSYYLLMMAYALVPVFVPNFNTFDSNGPKFLALAIINLLAFVVLFSKADFNKRPEIQSRFFKSFIGIAYSLFMIISLLSFFKSINLIESLLNIVKALTVFSSAYILSVIFSSNRHYLLHLAVVLTVLLLFDSVSVFYNMILYISRDVKSIMDIKSLYSHKNILASALFVKLPVALYLMFFCKGWYKRLGYIAGLSAVLATLMLSTRAFYLGLVLILIALFLYALTRQIVAGNKNYLRTIAIWTGVFIMALILYTGVQRVLFPKNTDTIWNTGIVTRLSSIKADESSANARLNSWKRTIQLIRDHPLLGVGTGNWKIVVLKYENERSPDFIYSYKNHNDFLEITAETGILGGLSFISIFILILVSFINEANKSGTNDNRNELLFIPAFGILAYSVDTFFNFPADRPEIQSLFAIYIGLAIAYSKWEIQVNAIKLESHFNSWIRNCHLTKLIAFIVLGFLVVFCIILYLNARSLHYQRLVRADDKSNNYAHTASFFIDAYPFIPTISSFGEPIAVQKAKYLINENRYKEAVSLLMSDLSSPYESRREFFISQAYYKAGMKDSAFLWMQRAYKLKPFHDQAVLSLSSWMIERGQSEESLKVLTKYLRFEKTNSSIWKYTENILWDDGQKERAQLLLDSAIKYLPYDTALINLKKVRTNFLRIAPYEELYHRIFLAFNSQNYSEAAKLLTEFIEKKTDYPEAFENRAICYNMIGKYSESIIDIDQSIKLGRLNFAMVNLRGENQIKLGNIESACRDFLMAKDKGIEKATENYQKFCLKK